MRRNKKGQVYGLSAFIYALAIAIILIVGLLGLSKEYDMKSAAGLYRFSSVIATKNAEIVKKLMDQERGYAVDKSLFVTGAFGGYSPDMDLVAIKNCTIKGCASTCPSDYSVCLAMSSNCSICANPCAIGYACDSTTGNCVSTIDSSDIKQVSCTPLDYGKCVKSLVDYYAYPSHVSLSTECYPNVKNTETGNTCGVITNAISYMGEKYVPRWRAGNTICTPPLSKVINDTFYEYAGIRYVNPATPLITGLAVATHSTLDMQYKLQINGLDETTGSLETSWFVLTNQPGNSIKIAAPAPPDNPVVEYTFSPFVHLFSNTSFFDIYKESKDFVDNSELSKILKNESSPIPVVVDEDFLVAKSDVSGNLRNCTTDPYPSDYCDMNSSEVPHPFTALVNYSAALSNTPNACEMPSASSVSRTYPHHCIVYTERDSNGQPIVTGYGDYCADDFTNDGAAMRCVMDRAINNINAKLKLSANAGDSIAPHNTSLGWKYEFNSFNLTFSGAPTVHIESGNIAAESDYMSSYVYNTTDTTPTSTCKSECTDAYCIGPDPYGLGYRYCSAALNLTGNVTTTINKFEVASCPTRKWGDAGAIINIKAVIPQAQINCQIFVNVTASAEHVGLGSLSKFSQLLLLSNSTPNYTTFTISEEQVSLVNTRALFNISTDILYPGNYWSAVGGTTNLSYCEEQTRSYTAFIPSESGGLHRGGFDCTQKSDCASGLGCSNNNVCIPCGANGDWPDDPDQHCCIGDSCYSGGTCRDDWCYTCGNIDLPCCSTGDACTFTNGTCNDTIESNAGFCKTCGLIGNPCCPGNVCTAYSSYCNTTTKTCKYNITVTYNPCTGVTPGVIRPGCP